jgi:DNA-binding transcriptional MerR regulator
VEKQEKLLSIEKVSLQLKIPKPTLRFWEKEFKEILVPLRTNGGQRRYTTENITVIEKIKELREEGKRLSEIKREINNSCKVSHELSAVNLLAERIAEVVKTEVYNFFERNKENLY